MSNKMPWRFSESRPIRPFRVSALALDSTEFRIRSEDDFSAEIPWSVVTEPEHISQPTFQPEFCINVDKGQLVTDTGVAEGDLSLAIVVRDSALWRSERIMQWPLREIPQRVIIPEQNLRSLSGLRGLEFLLQISPSHPLDVHFRTASKPGHLVCSRKFDVRVPEEGAGFPIQLVDQRHFEELGLPKETVWIIHWKDTAEFDRPVDEILCILINEDKGKKLLRVSSLDSVGSVLWREIAVEIFVEVCLTIFTEYQERPDNNDSLLGKMYQKLNRESGFDFDELVKIAKNTPESMKFFRAYLQKGLELGDRIQGISLAGRPL